MRRNRRRRPGVEEVVVYSYPPIIYFWPVVFSGLVLSGLHLVAPAPFAYGIAWWISLAIPILAMGINISGDDAVKVGGISLAATFLVWILWLYGLPLGWIGTLLANTCPVFNPGIALWTSTFGGLILLLSYVVTRLESHWVINPNTFQHTRWLRTVRIIKHEDGRMYVEYPDLLEWLLLFGGGDLVIKSNDGVTELDRIRNVPWVYSQWPMINELQEQQDVRIVGTRLQGTDAHDRHANEEEEVEPEE